MRGEVAEGSEGLVREWGQGRTWNDVTRVHGIFVLDEAKAIHELNLGDLASAMGVEVILNIGLGSYVNTVQSANSRRAVEA